MAKITENARAVLEKRYLMRDAAGELAEDVTGMVRRVADAVAQAEPEDQRAARADEFFRVMDALDFLANTPCLVNAGRAGGTGQLSACFVLPVEDSIDGIFGAVHRMAKVHQSGGGTGFGFSRLRPKGDRVSSGIGAASGPVSFMRIFNSSTEEIKQGGVRRGANMGILRVDHPDILEFIRVKADPLNPKAMENFNLSVGVTDAFMAAVAAGELFELVNPRTRQVTERVPARMLWDEIARCAWTTGDPGIVFIDRINAADRMGGVAGQIEATNPCQPAWATVLTPHGISTIADVRVGSRIWSGQRWTRVTGKVSTGKNPVLAFRTRAGIFFGTEGHRVVQRGVKVEVGRADSIDGSVGPAVGSLDGIGELARRNCMAWGLCIAGREQQLPRDTADEFAAELGDLGDIVEGNERDSVLQIKMDSLGEDRHPVDVYGNMRGGRPQLARDAVINPCAFGLNSGVATLFLRGVFSAIGSVSDSAVVARVASERLAQQLQELLSAIGIESRLVILGGGGRQEFEISVEKRASLARLYRDVGVIQRGLRAEIAALINQLEDGSRAEADAAAVTHAIYQVDVVSEEETFDLTVDAPEHTYWTGGLLVSNCGEVPLLPNDACTLGSINLAHFLCPSAADLPPAPDDLDAILRVDLARLRGVVRTAVRFLDDVLSVSRYPTPEITATVAAHRKIGLGVMGWADLLILLGVPYGSTSARLLAGRIMAEIREEADQASAVLAIERGPFPLWRPGLGLKRRNASLTVIAPTGSISIIAGCSSGIEPLFALSMTREQAGMRMTELSPHIGRLIVRNAVGVRVIMEEAERSGSVAKISGLSSHDRDVHRIASELTMEEHVLMQAAWQANVDDAVSKTINLSRTATVVDVQAAYQLAWDHGCKGITVYRDGCRDGQVLTAGAKQAPSVADDAPGDAARDGIAMRGIPEGGVGARESTTMTKRTPYRDAWSRALRMAEEGRAREKPVYAAVVEANRRANREVAESLGRAERAAAERSAAEAKMDAAKIHLDAMAKDARAVAQHVIDDVARRTTDARTRQRSPSWGDAERDGIAMRGIPEGGVGARESTTMTKRTPYGNAHVTVSIHPRDNEPFELFVNLGKSGSEVKAWTEAFGRCMSYLMSIPSPVSPSDRLRAIAGHLVGIGGGLSVGFGADAVASAPDAIAKLIIVFLDERARAGSAASPPHRADVQAIVETPIADLASAGPVPIFGQTPTTPAGFTIVGSVIPGAAMGKAYQPAATRVGDCPPPGARPKADICPECGQATIAYTKRCGECTACGWSKC